MADKPQDDDTKNKTDWAEWRTDWAEDRTVLANERTFAGWMRTGMAAIAIAVGLRAVFDEAEPTWVPKSVATVFILASLMIFWSAWRNSKKGQMRLETHDTEEQSSSTFGLLAGTFSVGAVAVCGILWTL
jgi:putative membrane protein